MHGRWGNTRWKLEAEERLLGMAWAADGRSALLAFSGARLGALYFTQPPPARDAQLLPLPLPELQSGMGQVGPYKRLEWCTQKSSLLNWVPGLSCMR